MDKWQLLARLLMQDGIGDEENPLIQRILKNYNLYSLSGFSRIGLMIFLLRSGSDFMQVLNETTPPASSDSKGK